MDNIVPDHAGVRAPSIVDGFLSDRASDSPPSSVGVPSRQSHKQVAISRGSRSGYERLERARTSHACEPCRERKTKCDGERPSCRRCLHTGTGCHYGYGKGWKKRKTAEDLTVTSSKLARYETLLDHIYPLVSPELRNMINEARRQDFEPPDLHGPLDSRSSTSLTPSDVDMTANSPSTQRASLPPLISLVQRPSCSVTTTRDLPASLPSESSVRLFDLPSPPPPLLPADLPLMTRAPLRWSDYPPLPPMASLLKMGPTPPPRQA